MTMTVQDIRSEFLGFFKKQGHEVVRSSSLVPDNDPTLMFANSGMVQFKNVFTGAETRPYRRATTAQKCVRAGGKHNDLDNVGYTARHHTFFEMMGNFSFGDYFKQDAIAFAWEMVTKNLSMPKDRLLVTVHASDEEAAAIWRKVAGLTDSKILRINTNDNFWMMGDTGPCGPCSEIFYDQGDRLAGGPPGSPDQDGDRFLEFWNLVFMQYEQEPDGKGGYNRKPLPKPSIDTGMGLERTCALVQGKYTNYDIDLLRSIIEHVADLTGVSPDGNQAAAHRVIADHLRACSFLMADGVMPSNEGRGYVLRRIMRRAMRYAHMLGAKEPMIYRLVPTLVAKMGEAYPEIRRAEALIAETLKMEETRFKRMLDNGLSLLEDETAKLGAGGKFPGETAFKLYDTYGFPLDLTQDALRSKSIEVDTDAFNKAMEEQREKARKAWKGSGDAGTEKVWFEVLEKFGPTEFLGYEKNDAEGKILAIVQGGKCVDEAKPGDDVSIVVNQTPFYAESGGQVGDTGKIIMTSAESGGGEIVIADVRKQSGKLWVHVGKVAAGRFSVGSAVRLIVDADRRSAIESNHSVTHLLHEALRLTLGDHIAQKGSLQDAGRTRFDVSQPTAITADQLRMIEEQVNEQIQANTEVVTRVLPLDEAMESGARALFGEKYDDEVRVVSIGTNRPGQNIPYSVELCGGTHVKRTGEIGMFKIISESAVSSGVRRIEALTGGRVADYLASQEQALQGRLDKLNAENTRLREELKGIGGGDLAAAIKSDEHDLIAHNKMLQKAIADLRRNNTTQSMGAKNVKEINGVRFTSSVLEGFPAKDLKPMVDDLKKKIGSGIVALISVDEGKASLVVGVTDDLTAKYSAVELAKKGVEALGGKNAGGRPDMAQGGGPNGADAQKALTVVEKAVA